MGYTDACTESERRTTSRPLLLLLRVFGAAIRYGYGGTGTGTGMVRDGDGDGGESWAGTQNHERHQKKANDTGPDDQTGTHEKRMRMGAGAMAMAGRDGGRMAGAAGGVRRVEERGGEEQ